VKRRTFIAGLGSAAAWPVVARAQQLPLPVIGYLGSQFADIDYKNVTVPFLQGLKEIGYVDGKNVSVEYRWAENQRRTFIAAIGSVAAGGGAQPAERMRRIGAVMSANESGTAENSPLPTH
jgi:putative ABC transport system substrate-binding protein